MCMLCILGMRGEGGIELESLVAVVRIVFILNPKAPPCLVFSITTCLQELLNGVSLRLFKGIDRSFELRGEISLI
jgi:hypothetical protein